MQLRWFAVFVTVALAVTALDQGSKAWARTLPVSPADCAQPGALVAHRCAGVPQPVISGLWDWELAYNDGVAFSALAGRAGARVLLSLLAIAAIVAVGLAGSATPRRARRAAYALVAGGALGNLIDRVRDGAVTDFVRWHVHGHMWPVFNVADAALLVGVLALVAEGIFGRPRAAGRTVAV